MDHFAQPINKLVNELTKLPGIGPKTAQRLALYLIKSDKSYCEDLAHSVIDLKLKIKQCEKCFNLADSLLCHICADDNRIKDLLCIVAEPQDILVIEKSREYKGLYHVLGGLISPMDGIGPDQLRIKEVLARIKDENINEIIIATSPNIQGEATAMYLSKLIKPLDIKLTRIASGIPMGADIEYADEYTMAKAIEGRREY